MTWRTTEKAGPDRVKLQIASFVLESRMRLSPLESHTYFTSISDVHSYGTRQPTSERVRKG